MEQSKESSQQPKVNGCKFTCEKKGDINVNQQPSSIKATVESSQSQQRLKTLALKCENAKKENMAVELKIGSISEKSTTKNPAITFIKKSVNASMEKQSLAPPKSEIGKSKTKVRVTTKPSCTTQTSERSHQSRKTMPNPEPSRSSKKGSICNCSKNLSSLFKSSGNNDAVEFENIQNSEKDRNVSNQKKGKIIESSPDGSVVRIMTFLEDGRKRTVTKIRLLEHETLPKFDLTLLNKYEQGELIKHLDSLPTNVITAQNITEYLQKSQKSPTRYPGSGKNTSTGKNPTIYSGSSKKTVTESPPTGYPPSTKSNVTENPCTGYPVSNKTTITEKAPTGYPGALENTVTRKDPTGHSGPSKKTITENAPIAYTGSNRKTVTENAHTGYSGTSKTAITVKAPAGYPGLTKNTPTGKVPIGYPRASKNTSTQKYEETKSSKT